MSGFPAIEDHAANESLWLQQTRPLANTRRPDLASKDVDVLIVGGGFTGLWTAYSLARQAPDLRIAVHEARHIGFGASGRAGGWAVGMLSGQRSVLSAVEDGMQRNAIAQQIAQTVDHIAEIAREEQIDCGLAKGGMLRIAAFGARQDHRFPGVLQEHREESAGTTAASVLGRDEASARINVDGATRAFHWPHCAVINPAQLAVGLAEACIRRGVEIVEASPVRSIGPNWAQTAMGGIRAAHIVAATEGYSDGVTGLAGRIIPVYSLLLATRPLTDSEWASVGLAEREAFSDCAPISTYGQRSADGRLVFGAFGLYPARARAGAAAGHFAGDFRLLERYLKRLLPQLKDVEITHRWTGTLGVPRTMHPAAGKDAASGLVMAGGYVARGIVGGAVFGSAVAASIADGPLANRLPPVLPIEQAFPRWEGPLLRYLGTAISLNPERWAEHVAQSSLPKPFKSVASWLAGQVPVIVH